MAGQLSRNEVANMSSLRLILTCVLSLLVGHLAVAGPPIDLSPLVRDDSQTRVTIQLEAGGHTFVSAKDSAAENKSTNDKGKAAEQKLPLSVVAKFEYDERRLADAT